MAKRIKVGIIYENNENWIGGTYYIQNLVFSLNRIEDRKKPHLVIICKTEEEYLQIKGSGYPYLSWFSSGIQPQRLNTYKKLINKITHVFTSFDYYPQLLKLDVDDCDIIFPAPVGLVTKSAAKNIYWIPDFQEQVLPHFFSNEEIHNRTQYHHFIAKTRDDVVFSSEDAYKTFVKLFPRSKVNKHILRFAVNHTSAYKDLNIEVIKQKYKIDKPYFFAPNQFWKHKNQTVILKAVALLKEQGSADFIVAFSGKEYDYRNPDYFQNIKNFVKAHHLDEQIVFLGFIDRNEQLKLMSGALAIIQPSLFEGWSTVVEDAKALNQWIIASDLPVHREQLKFNVNFFHPSDAQDLARVMRTGIESGYIKTESNYESYLNQFAYEFIDIVTGLMK